MPVLASKAVPPVRRSSFAFQSWIAQLRWPQASVHQAEVTAGGGISWTELAVDFEVAKGVDIPPSRRALR